ncbi:MAG: peptidyl-prolyl cis-trans isomerase [Bryobacterales bacterium]
MKIQGFCLAATLALGLSAFAQEVPVVTINGKGYTSAELDHIRKNLPDVFRRQTEHMNNKTFVDTLGFLLTVSDLAEQEGMTEKEPYKTQLWFNTINFLSNAYLAQINSKLEIGEKDVEEYYEQHKGEYEEKRVSAIYLDYDPLPELAEKQGRTPVTEQDAWSKAEKLLVEMRNGADFAAIAKEHSSDAGTAEKGGDLGFFSPDDQSLSPDVKKAIFALAEGQISSPVKDGGRYYVFKVTEVRARPLDAVKAQVLQKVQTTKLQKRLEEIRNSVKIDYTDPAYFDNAAPAAQ